MNFWRKSGQKDTKNNNKVFSANCNGTSKVFSNWEQSEQKIQYLHQLFLAELETIDKISESNKSEKSRLSKTLTQVLTDKSALGYFIQYLELRGALHYIKFWLDVESFRSAMEISKITTRITITRDEIDSTPTTTNSVSHDSLSVSTDCESIAADSLIFESLDLETDPVNNLNNQTFSSQDQKICRDLIDDACRIYKKYIVSSIRFSDDIRSRIVKNFENLTSNCFDEGQQYVYRILETDFFNEFLRSGFHCKHQVDILTSGNITLYDILYNETALFYFMEFLEQEQIRDILEFWIAVINFQANFDSSSEQMQLDAIVVYDKYFSLQAKTPLGFPDCLRLEIEGNICDENGVSVKCFEKPLRLVETILEKHFLKTFLTSELFFKYLSELISTIQLHSVAASTGGRHRRIGSDSSSEVSSISAHNTLLAMEDRNSSLRTKIKSDMSIDTRHLYDPDSLWRRNQNGLMLGRITELGRFETDIEPEPDRKGQSKIGLVMKKLVHLQEDKTKEEMAWQIAEMIVKDITSLTLNQQS